MSGAEILLVYDGQCPLCRAYSRMLRIRESVGELRMVDAREDTAVRDEITAQGLDIDQGIVLKMGERLYYGVDAIHALALISSPSGFFNRLNYQIFKSQTLARWLYPLLRAGRNLLLKILGKNKINNLQLPDNQRF